MGSDQVSDILSLSQQLAGEDTVRITRQPVQVTWSYQEFPQHNTFWFGSQVQDITGEVGTGETPYGGICGRRHAGVRGGGVTGRVKNTGTLGGDTQFGE